jgi:hypothetical protein
MTPTTAREFADELFGAQDDWCGGEECCRCGPTQSAHRADSGGEGAK